jgi:hypothetical protein
MHTGSALRSRHSSPPPVAPAEANTVKLLTGAGRDVHLLLLRPLQPDKRQARDDQAALMGPHRLVAAPPLHWSRCRSSSVRKELPGAARNPRRTGGCLRPTWTRPRPHQRSAGWEGPRGRQSPSPGSHESLPGFIVGPTPTCVGRRPTSAVARNRPRPCWLPDGPIASFTVPSYTRTVLTETHHTTSPTGRAAIRACHPGLITSGRVSWLENLAASSAPGSLF